MPLMIYCTAALTSFSDSISYITFIFGMAYCSAKIVIGCYFEFRSNLTNTQGRIEIWPNVTVNNLTIIISKVFGQNFAATVSQKSFLYHSQYSSELT